ncbi:D-2-hydroxyacid dehydrogenase [Dysosmobacter sp.]
MKIVVLDGYTENPGDLSWGGLEALGELTVYERTSLTDEGEIIERIGDAEIVLTNKTPISRAVMEACPQMKFISVLATGYNVIDTAAAGERGIPVANVPVYGTRSVSQFAVALLLEVCHHIGHHSQTVFEGKWQTCKDWCYWDYPLIELAGKTYGLLGCGNIGIHTAEIVKALGMRVIACDKKQTDAGKRLGVAYVDLETLFAESDVLGLQMPLFPFNTGIINKETISKMKDGVIIINNSRGQMVVEQDLADALNSGKVAAAALDVVSTEPILGSNPLLKAKNCIITPHMSWGAKESRQRIMDCTVKNVTSYLSGSPENVVNPMQ